MVNPENIEEMPYDLDTYGSCQVFFKDYASPIKIDTKDIGDTLDGNDVISSKKYKTFMNQNVLKQIFSGSGLEMKKLLWIMFISLGLNVITLLAVMMVIAG